MMLRSGTKCGAKCSFCAMSFSPHVSGFRCENGDFTPKKKMKLETNSDTHHQALHEALSSKDCGTVSHLLENGEKLCSTDGIENCFILITKFYNIECLEKVLSSQPSAIHCRGPQGQTLLMYAENFNILKTLFKFEPDVNACNDSGEDVLIHFLKKNIKNYSSSYVMFIEMAQFIVDKGINATTTDALGKTAIEYVLDFDMSRNFSDIPLDTDDLFKKLLKAGATMPQADSTYGLTPAMHFARRRAYMSNYFEFIIDLLQQGVDPKARDKERHNLMYYVVTSYFTAVRYTFDSDDDDYFHPWYQRTVHDEWAIYADDISRDCLKLLHCGCEFGGLDKIFDRNRPFSYRVGDSHLLRGVAKSVNILSLLLRCSPFSEFMKELPQYNLTLKKSSKCISELTYYFLDYDDWPITARTFEMVDATVTHLLASGVNVMQQTKEGCYLVDRDADKLEKEIVLTLPDSLWFAGQILLKVAEKFKRSRDELKKPYTISCKILVTLLRFWKYPPLALFDFIYVDFLEASFSVQTTLKFLTRVGGRLPPGSQLFKCLMENLEKHAKRDQKVRVLPLLLSKLHKEIPSLKELCRTAVRATLSKITTSGLDLSSLPQVLCQGELREIPMEIQDYLNFKDQPLFCEEDLAD